MAIRYFASLVGCAIALATPVAAQETAQDNAEMAAMFEADQAQRSEDTEDHEAAARADEMRRQRTRELFQAGELKTGADFLGAAFIFQHGGEPRDYLLAHAMAVRALGLGHKDAEWIAAATLDRYLQSIGQPQVYGSQFRFPSEGGVTMEPYDRTLLVDSVRKAASVGDLAAQERKLEEYAKLVSGDAGETEE